jgi:hypothetical protein
MGPGRRIESPPADSIAGRARGRPSQGFRWQCDDQGLARAARPKKTSSGLGSTGTRRTALMEHSLAVSTEPRWSESQRIATLAAIDIVKTFFKADRVAAGTKINEYLKEIGPEGVISGYNAFCGMLVTRLRTDERGPHGRHLPS